MTVPQRLAVAWTRRCLPVSLAANSRTAAVANHQHPNSGSHSGSYYSNNNNNGHPATIAAALCCLGGASFVSTSHAEAAVTTIEEENNNNHNNPLWPRGVSQADLDLLVEECLRDPSINIATLPDALERQVYRNTIQLTLNAVYESLAEYHGLEWLGHELVLTRISSSNNSNNNTTTLEDQLKRLRHSIDEDVLEQVADRLLANPHVNQPQIPDVLERQLYLNCLKIMFRLLDLLAATCVLTVCGHDFQFHIHKHHDDDDNHHDNTTKQTEKAKSSATHINADRLVEYARATLPTAAANETWWLRLLPGNTLRTDFQVQLYATLYALLLGVADDFLANTQVRLLSDVIEFDFVPIRRNKNANANQSTTNVTQDAAGATRTKPSAVSSSSSAVAPVAFLSFLAGCGVGMAIVTSSLFQKRN